MAEFGSSFDFWIVVLGLTIGIAALLLVSLLLSRKTAEEPGLTRDIQIYRDQLSGVERDLKRGTLSDAEAGKLKTEVARRLLEADRRATRQTRVGNGQNRKALILPGVLIVLALAAAVGLYTQLGQPGRLDLPLAERIAQADARLASRPNQEDYVASLQPRTPPQVDAELAELMEKLRAAVDPTTATDQKGLQLLAYNEARLGNFSAALTAQQRLISVKGTDVQAKDYVSLAEMLMAQAEGYVSPEAEAALRDALRLAPQDKAAAYYTGLLYAQGGRFDKAFAIWQPLMEQTTAADPWAQRLREDVVLAAQAAGVRYEPPELPSAAADAAGPTADEAKAAGAVMVEQLASRLGTQGGSAEEWAQLIKSLLVLGREDQAKDILREAQGQYPDGDARALLDKTARENGLEPNP